MLERLRQRLDLLAKGANQVDAVRRRRDQVVCEYLAEYRKLCSQVGPWAYAADIGAATTETNPQAIAYLAAWHDMADDCDFIDEAVTAARAGFDDWLAANPEAANPE